MRQVCDWSRLLWVYKEEISVNQLEKRLRAMGLMTEWKAFAAYSVNNLGMRVDAMPFYSEANKWYRKAQQINRFMMRVGNMGHNRTTCTKRSNYFILRKMKSLCIRIADLSCHVRLFPLESLRFFPNIIWRGIQSALKGIG